MSRICEICKINDASSYSKRCNGCGNAILVSVDTSSDSGEEHEERDLLEYSAPEEADELWLYHVEDDDRMKRRVYLRQSLAYVMFRFVFQDDDCKPAIDLHVSKRYMTIHNQMGQMFKCGFPSPVIRAECQLEYQKKCTYLRVVVRKNQPAIWPIFYTVFDVPDKLKPSDCVAIRHIEWDLESDPADDTILEPVLKPDTVAAAAEPQYSPYFGDTQVEEQPVEVPSAQPEEDEARFGWTSSICPAQPLPEYSTGQSTDIQMTLRVAHSTHLPANTCCICCIEESEMSGPLAIMGDEKLCGACRTILLGQFHKCYTKSLKKVKKMAFLRGKGIHQ